MPVYKANATATASVTAQFFFRKEILVTASGSAAAESNVSEEDAYNIALNIAKEVAQSSAQNDANVIIQSVNTSTLGDNTLLLSSSLLNGYITQVSSNVYDLVKDFSLTKYILNIETDEILNIKEGITLTGSFINKGTINNYGNYISSDFTQKLQKNIRKTNKSTTSSPSGYYIASACNLGTCINYNNITLQSYQTLTNFAIIINYGMITINGAFYNYGEYIQDISGNTPETNNYNIIENYNDMEYPSSGYYANVVQPGVIYYGTIQINGGSFYNQSEGIINLNYSNTGSEIPSGTYFLTISNGNMYCQDPSGVIPPTDYYNVYWSYTTTPTTESETPYGPIYSNSYTIDTSDSYGNPYALAAQQTNSGIITFYSN